MKYCTQCGALLSETEGSCRNCGAQVLGTAERPVQAPPGYGSASTGPLPSAGPSVGTLSPKTDYPPKYRPWAITLLSLSVIACGLWGIPGSIVALVYGGKVDELMRQAKFAEAWRASKVAKYWLIGSTALSALVFVGLILFYVIAASLGK